MLQVSGPTASLRPGASSRSPRLRISARPDRCVRLRASRQGGEPRKRHLRLLRKQRPVRNHRPTQRNRNGTPLVRLISHGNRRASVGCSTTPIPTNGALSRPSFVSRLSACKASVRPNVTHCPPESSWAPHDRSTKLCYGLVTRNVNPVSSGTAGPPLLFTIECTNKPAFATIAEKPACVCQWIIHGRSTVEVTPSRVSS